jgi:uncharacterized integral membrane protein
VDSSADQTSARSSADRARRAAAKGPTRISWAWGTLIVGILLGIALVDFLAQNTPSVRIEFFSVSGHVPIVVALLVAALAGGAIVVVVGLARMLQLGRGQLTGKKPATAGEPSDHGPEYDRNEDSDLNRTDSSPRTAHTD